MDPLLLARIQFAANISFHILFPTITLALCWVLLFFKWRYHRTKDPMWMGVYGFWVKIFALSFALGVVSGITMSFQFGTNWPGFMNTVGNIAGPLLAYEVLTAFFLEATFLGIMLFGFSRVGNRWHTVATFLVAIGTTLSAFWILVLNSWMHTPAGFEFHDGVAHASNWFDIIFNPSMPYRFAHMLGASFLTVSFLVAGISAYRILRGDHKPGVMATLRVGIISAAILAPTQALLGDLHGLNTRQHQPAKIAAVEAIWKTEAGAPLTLIGWPDQDEGRTHFAVKVPKLASLILAHDPDATIAGLDQFPDAHPPVAPIFFSFRVMVGIGLLMWMVAWTALWQHRKGQLPKPWILQILVLMSFSGWLAVLAGWYTTEIGRQPWLVHGLLRTTDAVAATPTPLLSISLGLYLTIYVALIFAFLSVVFYLAKKAVYAPAKIDHPTASGPPVLPLSPKAADHA